MSIIIYSGILARLSPTGEFAVFYGYAILFCNEMLSYIQIVLAVILGALILIQQSEGSLGAAFGGSGMDGARRTRRGPELWIFRGTIVIACLFVASAVLNLLY